VSAPATHGPAIEQSPTGAGTTEAPRRELTEDETARIVRSEATERLEAAAQLTSPTHTTRATRLRAEAAILLRLLEEHDATKPH
jgi:hypothetical protein